MWLTGYAVRMYEDDVCAPFALNPSFDREHRKGPPHIEHPRVSIAGGGNEEVGVVRAGRNAHHVTSMAQIASCLPSAVL